MQRKMAEFKQNLSLQLFELKQENEDLKSMLDSNNSSYQSSSDVQRMNEPSRVSTLGTDSGVMSREQTALDEFGMGDTSSLTQMSQSNLVVRLSSKIQEQELEIERLKKELYSNRVADS